MASCDEFSLAECKWLESNSNLNTINSRRASVTSSSSSDSDSGFKVLEGLDSKQTEVALEQLRKWVDRKSRHLSMSKQDRLHFQEATSRYFAELSSTLSREAASDQAPPDEGDARSASSEDDSNEWVCEDVVRRVEAHLQRSMERAEEAAEAKQMEAEAEQVAKQEEAEAEQEEAETEQAAEQLASEEARSRQSRILCFEEHACLFDSNSAECACLMETLQGFLGETEEFFQNQTLVELMASLRVLVLYNLEAVFDEFSHRPDSEALVRSVRTELQAFRQLFDAQLTPHMFRQAYECLQASCRVSSPEALSDQSQEAGVHDIFLFDGMLVACFETFMDRTAALPLSSIRLRCEETCRLCCLDEQLVVRRECCSSSVCYSCYKEWVRTKVFSRTVEVGCPCCDSYLTSLEIVEFLGENSGRYHEIITDLNGDPNKKTCPHCNLVTQSPGGKAHKRTGGQLLRCSRCEFTWCFRCQSPPHPGTSCRTNSSGKQLLRDWGANTYLDGSQQVRKARRCPSCKVWIEKNQGCNHMTCSHCSHEFCYICGKDWRGGNLLFGRHSSRLSIFGCKQKLLPKKPVLRKLIRGTLFVLETIGIAVGAPIVVGLLLALSPILGIIGIAALIYRCKH